MERRRYPPPSYNPVRPGQSRKGSYPHGGRGKARHPQRYGPSPVTVQQLPRATNSNPFGFNIAPPQPKSLPDDHPLKVELAKVREHREKRKKYWAGLAMTIPEEMRNEGSYDYQRWQAEDRLAEEAIENLVKMITAAELGFQVVERPVVLDSKDQARLARENKKRQQRAMEHERLYEPERRKSIGIGDLNVKNWVQGVGQQPLQEADSRLGTECVPSLQEDAVSITESEFDRIEATREAEREAAGRLEAERIRQTEAIRLSSAEQSDHVLGSKEQTPVATDQGVTGIEASVVPSSPAKATGYRSPDAGEQSSPDGGVKLIPKPVSEALQPVPSTATQPTAISGVEAQKDAVMSEADDLDIERNQEDMLAALLLEIHGPPESGTVEEDTAETSAITPAFDKKMTLSPAPDMAPAVAKELPSAANKASPVPTFPSFPAGNKPSTISTAASTVPKGASPIPTFPSFPTGIRASPIPLPAFPTGNKPSTVSTSASTVPKFPSFPGVPTAPAPTTPLDASNSSVASIFPTPIAKPTVHTAPTTSVSTTPITVPSIFKASVATTFPAPISTPTVKAAITAPAVPKTSISLPASSGLVLNKRTVERNIAFQEISAAKLGNPNWKVPTAAIGVSASSGLTIPQVATPQPFQSQAIPAPPVVSKASAAPVHDVERRDAPSIPSSGTPGNPTPKLSVMALARARLIARQKEVAAKSAEAAPIIQSIEVEPPARAQPKSSNYRAGKKRPRTKSRKPGPDDDYMDLDIDKFNDPVEVVDMQDRSNSDSEGGPLINRARIPKHSRQIKDVRPTAPLATRTNSIKSVKMPNPSKPTPISKNHDRQQAKLPRAADAREPEDLTRRVLRTGNLVSEVTEEDIAGLFEGSQIDSIILPRDPQTGNNVDHAFVIFSTVAEAETALKGVTKETTIEGRRVGVRFGAIPAEYVGQYKPWKPPVEDDEDEIPRGPRTRVPAKISKSAWAPPKHQNPPKPMGNMLDSLQPPARPATPEPGPGIHPAGSPTKLVSFMKPKHDAALVASVDEMILNPQYSLTSMSKAERKRHLEYVQDLIQKIYKYKAKRAEGQVLSAREIKRVNRTEDYERYEKELQDSLIPGWNR